MATVQHVATTTRPRRLAGLVCAVTGVLLTFSSSLADLAVDPDVAPGMARLAHLPLLLCVPGLMAGVLALAGMIGADRSQLTRVGRNLALGGLGCWFVAGLFLIANPGELTLISPLGSVLVAIGMVLLGVQSMRAGVLPGLSRIVPFLVGLWFFVQFPIQFVFFIPVYGHPWYTLLVGVWGILWAALGFAIRAGER